jgi:hypothetical protein
MIVLIISDSLAFPRVFPELVSYPETYISILKKQFPKIDFIHVGIGGGTIKALYQYSEYYHKTLKPDLVFIQSGIVDCAPRTLTLIESEIIKRIPFLNNFIFKIIRTNSYFLRKYRRITYTDLSTFDNYVGKFEEAFERVYWINILPVVHGYEDKVSGIKENIDKFNSILHKNKNIETSDLSSEDVQSDFHHLSVLGHKKMSLKLAGIIEDYNQ